MTCRRRHGLALALIFGLSACRDINVTTQHNDVNRTGSYVAETELTPKTVREQGLQERFRLVHCDFKGRSFGDTRPPRPLPAGDVQPCLNGPILTQPLYVHNVPFRPKNETVNGVFVATQWNWVYAINAQTGAWEWATDLALDNNGGYVQAPCQWVNNTCGTGWLARGVNSAPVIDVGANRMYVLFSTRLEIDIPVNCTGASEDLCRYLKHLVTEADVNYWLVALDLRDGVELNRVRVGTQARARKSDGTWLTFDDRQQLDRPGLLLDRGSIYVAFGADASLEGRAFYHGWVMKYRAGDLAFQAAFCTSPNSGRAAGIWQGGGGLAADAQGRVYFLTGNGPAPTITPNPMFEPLHPGPANAYGDSIVRLTPTGPALVPAAFVPDGAATLEAADADLGSGGAMVIPDTNLVIGGGKSGYMYLLDRGSMKLQQAFAASTNLYQPTWRDQCWNGGPHLHGSPTFWNDNLYVWGEKDVLKLYKFDRTTNKFPETSINPGQVFQTDENLADRIGAATGSPGGGGSGGGSGAPAGPPPVPADIASQFRDCFVGTSALTTGPLAPHVPPAFRGTIRALLKTMPGGMLSVSADGTNAHTGVVWATLPVKDWPTSGPYAGRLYAFDAENLKWLWEADWGGTLAHWVPPTIANGRVFLATNEYLIAYGLCSRGEPCPASGPHQPVSGCTGCHSQGRMLDILRTTRMEDFPNGAAMRGFAAQAFRDLSLPPRYAKTIVLEGEGVQTYEAAPSASERGKFVWLPATSTGDLAAIDASSSTRERIGTVRLSDGWIWSARDGSAVAGEIDRTTIAPEMSSAPWMLFKTTSKGAPGALAQVKYIQRVHTHAGHPPPAPPDRAGQVARMPFYAQYWLYE